jgi:multidrug resistance efflux pump
LNRLCVTRDFVSGTIENDEFRVASRYGGRVEEVFAREGELLKPGQPIFRLEASELQARRAQAAALLEELRAGPRKEEIEAAKNDWQALLSELEFARADLKRIAELYEQETVSETERDRALTRARALEQSVAAANSRYELLLAGTRSERIAQAEAELRAVEANLREMQLASPTNAVLEVLHARAGDVAAPNQPLATLVMPDHLWARVYVPEPWLGFIELGQKVKVSVDSFPGREFAGEVEHIARTAEFTPRNVQTVSDRIRQVFGVKIRLPTDAGLRAGMAADVVFPNVPKE